MGSTITPDSYISPINIASNQNHFLPTQKEFYPLNTSIHWTTNCCVNYW